MQSSSTKSLLATERRSVLGLALVYAIRMLGLFLILPVFSLYARELPGTTPFMIGLAIGIYGLTQAFFQIPLGILSDRIGRKSVIIGGLCMLFAGSIVAALASSIEGIIFGRALQGCGAIAAATLALVGDLTRDSVRSRAMAVVGMSIGLSFFIAMIIAPWLDSLIGIQGIFYFTAGLAILAIILVLTLVPSSQVVGAPLIVQASLTKVLRNSQLLRLDLGIFCLHLLLTADFVVLPLMLLDYYQLEPARHSWLYAGCLVGSVILMAPFLIHAEKNRQQKNMFLGALGILILSHIGLALLPASLVVAVILLLLFLAAFNFLEASLPALVTRNAPATLRGAATGVYSSSQFFGIFCGGVLGGWVFGEYGMRAVFLISAVFVMIWLVFALGMREPTRLNIHVVDIPEGNLNDIKGFGDKLAALPGVAEVTLLENKAHIEVDPVVFDQQALALLV